MPRPADLSSALLYAAGSIRKVCAYLALLALPFATPLAAESPSSRLPPDVTRFILANTEFSLMHEMGHMLIIEYDLPVLGREEDAADQLGFLALFELYSALPTAEVDARLLDIADYWRLEWQRPKPVRERVLAWDAHPLDEQRYYNIACLLYGSDMRRLDWVPELTELPYERALYCDREFRQARKALDWASGAYRHKAIQRRAAIQVTYGQSSGAIPDFDQLLAPLLEDNNLQRLAEDMIKLFHPPRPLTLRVMACGAPDAWYNSNIGELTLCYERLAHFRELAETLPRLQPPFAWRCPNENANTLSAC